MNLNNCTQCNAYPAYKEFTAFFSIDEYVQIKCKKCKTLVRTYLPIFCIINTILPGPSERNAARKNAVVAWNALNPKDEK